MKLYHQSARVIFERPPEVGDYEVRRYGSQGNSRKFYEVAGGLFTKDPEPVPPAATD